MFFSLLLLCRGSFTVSITQLMRVLTTVIEDRKDNCAVITNTQEVALVQIIFLYYVILVDKKKV